MSKISQFKNWYKKYLKACNECYDKSVEEDYKKTEELVIKLDKFVQIRTSETNMNQFNSLDIKIETIRKILKELYKRIDDIDQIKKEMEEKLKMNSSKIIYERILKHPLIREIIITETSLSIITEKLFSNKECIGYYQITIESGGMHCSARNTRIKNLDYVVENRYDHWHVENQSPCLGAWKDILQRHLDTYQLFLFFDTFIHYLTLSDSAHAYISFEKWLEKFTKREEENSSSRIEMNIQRSHGTSVGPSLIGYGTIGTAANITHWGSWT